MSNTPHRFSNKDRAERLEKVKTERYDLIIIGGGITGAGIALDASLRGLKTILIEKKDFASEPSLSVPFDCASEGGRAVIFYLNLARHFHWRAWDISALLPVGISLSPTTSKDLESTQLPWSKVLASPGPSLLSRIFALRS